MYVIDAVLKRRDLLPIQPTGSGKFIILLDIFVMISVDIFAVYTSASNLPQPQVMKDIL